MWDNNSKKLDATTRLNTEPRGSAVSLMSQSRKFFICEWNGCENPAEQSTARVCWIRVRSLPITLGQALHLSDSHIRATWRKMGKAEEKC